MPTALLLLEPKSAACEQLQAGGNGAGLCTHCLHNRLRIRCWETEPSPCEVSDRSDHLHHALDAGKGPAGAHGDASDEREGAPSPPRPGAPPAHRRTRSGQKRAGWPPCIGRGRNHGRLGRPGVRRPGHDPAIQMTALPKTQHPVQEIHLDTPYLRLLGQLQFRKKRGCGRPAHDRFSVNDSSEACNQGRWVRHRQRSGRPSLRNREPQAAWIALLLLCQHRRKLKWGVNVTVTPPAWANNVSRTSNFPFQERPHLLVARSRLRVRGHPAGGLCCSTIRLG